MQAGRQNTGMKVIHQATHHLPSTCLPACLPESPPSSFRLTYLECCKLLCAACLDLLRQCLAVCLHLGHPSLLRQVVLPGSAVRQLGCLGLALEQLLALLHSSNT